MINHELPAAFIVNCTQQLVV